jgi:NAD(P)-dependent dehydrogenase (short-subunit alcohol dehydrogenase family)
LEPAVEEKTNPERVALVTGSSSGIGFETSVLLAKNGFNTYATVRNIKKSQASFDIAKNDGLPLETVELDVTIDKSVNDAINKILLESKRIDVVVNNAGYAPVGACCTRTATACCTRATTTVIITVTTKTIIN